MFFEMKLAEVFKNVAVLSQRTVEAAFGFLALRCMRCIRHCMKACNKASSIVFRVGIV